MAQGVVGGAEGKGGMSCVLKDIPEGWLNLALDHPSLDSGDDKFPTFQVTLVGVFCSVALKSIQTDKTMCAVPIFILLSDTGNQSLESISQVTERTGNRTDTAHDCVSDFSLLLHCSENGVEWGGKGRTAEHKREQPGELLHFPPGF